MQEAMDKLGSLTVKSKNHANKKPHYQVMKNLIFNPDAYYLLPSHHLPRASRCFLSRMRPRMPSQLVTLVMPTIIQRAVKKLRSSTSTRASLLSPSDRDHEARGDHEYSARRRRLILQVAGEASAQRGDSGKTGHFSCRYRPSIVHESRRAALWFQGRLRSIDAVPVPASTVIQRRRGAYFV